MVPSDSYFNYLSRFSKTTTVGSLTDASIEHSIALRHDIDHNLDIALDFAYYENKADIKATYFILHDHPYNADKLFLEKLLQIQDYGHEIGVHLNLLAGWYQGYYDNPGSYLHAWLDKVRDAGIRIRGCATHGDKLCYKIGVVNSWFFKEQRKSKHGYAPITPEGIADPNGNNVIPFPERAQIEREDGSSLNLFQANMNDFGLDYEAVDLACNYWSDTGKDWHRTGDPLNVDLSKGRHQVLMHPIHWVSEARKMFFVSTARVGSKWLTKSLQQSSAANVKHEWTLNHRQRNSAHVQEKITTLDAQALDLKPEYAMKLIDYSLRYSSSQRTDDIELNVYLIDHIEYLLEACPGAEVYGIVRNGADVVASLLERGWYASTNTIRHPYNQVYYDKDLNQFQKACRYWRDTNVMVQKFARQVFAIEEIATDSESYGGFLRSIDLPAHQRVLEALSYAPVDMTASRKYELPENWSRSSLEDYSAICGEVAQAYGYRVLDHDIRTSELKNKEDVSVQDSEAAGDLSEQLSEFREIDFLDGYFSEFGMNAQRLEEMQGLEVLRDSAKLGWLIFAGGVNATWGKIPTFAGIKLGVGDFQIDGTISFRNLDAAPFRLFYLEYDSLNGHLTKKKLLTQLLPGWRGKFSEHISPGTNSFCFAIHASADMSGKSSENRFSLTDFSVKISVCGQTYLF